MDSFVFEHGRPPIISQFVSLIGIELEGFTEHESCADLSATAGGRWEDDAGLNLCEAITIPRLTVEDAMACLHQLVRQLPGVVFTPFRPEWLMHNKGRWHEKPRYETLLAALKQEKPVGHDWVVQRMPDCAALQINISGYVDPFGDDGAFLINIFNDIAPWVATMVHREVRLGYGHLALWQKYARAERLPLYGRWFASGSDMVSYIESVPKLIKRGGGGPLVSDLTEKQSVKDPLDLGAMWWFLRPKVGEYGTYLEFRFLPSMPLSLVERYAQLVLDMVEVLLEWFHYSVRAQPVTREAALPAYRALFNHFPHYVPQRPLSYNEWQQRLRS